MIRLMTPDFLQRTFWVGRRRRATSVHCISAISILGAFRAGADSECAIADLALLPVLVIAWINVKNNGLYIGVLAAVMWHS
jgi:hypothetical protein